MRDYERITQFIEGNRWIFAKTMAYIPHWYCLLKEYNDKNEFTWAVWFMRINGREAKFWNKTYRYFHLNGFKYWDMDPTPETCDLINRDNYKKPFLLFDGEKLANPSDEEKEFVLSHLSLKPSDKVMEIGFTDDTVVGMCSFSNCYTGCTVDVQAYNSLTKRRPGYTYVADRFENLYYGEQDIIVALYGAADQIRDSLAIDRLLAHTNDETRFMLMYGKGNPMADEAEEKLGLERSSVGKYEVLYRL